MRSKWSPRPYPPPAVTLIDSGLLAARLLRSEMQRLRVLHRMGRGMQVRWQHVSHDWYGVYNEIRDSLECILRG